MTGFARPFRPGTSLLRALAIVGLPPVVALAAALLALEDATRAGSEAATAAKALETARSHLASAAPPDAPARLLVQGGTIGVSAAGFHTLVSDLAQLSGVTLDRIDPVVAEPAGALTRMRSKALLSGPEAAILSLVLNAEAAEPLIFLDRVDLSVTGQEGATLRVELSLSAYAAIGRTP